jgi:single-strand DNA-binding protein
MARYTEWPGGYVFDSRQEEDEEEEEMDGMNKAILVGNLGMDPELKFTRGGQSVLKLRLATTESYLDKNNERKERTDWHSVVVWGKRAEGLNKVLQKGSTVWVEGRIQTRSWEDKDGGKKYATEINATDIGLLGGKGGSRQEHEPEMADEVRW